MTDLSFRFLDEVAPGEAELKALFLSEPIYSNRYAQGFGTVFTTIYRPATGRVEIGWKDGTFISWNLQDHPPSPVRVRFGASGSAIVSPGRTIQDQAPRPILIRNAASGVALPPSENRTPSRSWWQRVKEFGARKLMTQGNN